MERQFTNGESAEKVFISKANYRDFLNIFTGKTRRQSKFEEEFSDGQLGINERELNSMNKHIPGKTKNFLRMVSLGL